LPTNWSYIIALPHFFFFFLFREISQFSFPLPLLCMFMLLALLTFQHALEQFGQRNEWCMCFTASNFFSLSLFFLFKGKADAVALVVAE
jgi:hypothetical protein